MTYKRIFIVLAVLLLVSTTVAKDKQGYSKYCRFLENSKLFDYSSVSAYEDGGILYFFDDEEVYTNIYGLVIDENIYFCTNLGAQLYIFDSSFNYLGGAENEEEDLLDDSWLEYDLLFNEQEYDVEDANSASDIWRDLLDLGFGDTKDLFKGDEDENSRGTYIGRLSANSFDYESVSNPYGPYGNPFSATSINNPFSKFGNPFSAFSTTNPYATNAPKLFAPDGTYLGRISANKYDYESINNPYGPYGNPYSPTSINNPYGRYGNPYSTSSVTNPYSLDAPLIYGDDD